MMLGVIGSTPNVAAPRAATGVSERQLIEDCFVSREAPDFVDKAVSTLQTLSRSADLGLRARGDVALQAVLAANGGPLALQLCRTAFSALQETAELKLGAFAARLAGHLKQDADEPIMRSITRAVAPHYGMAPGTTQILDDLQLFMGPNHAKLKPHERIACMQPRMEQLGRFDDDYAYGSFLLAASRDGGGASGQVGEMSGRALVGGILVRKRR